MFLIRLILWPLRLLLYLYYRLRTWRKAKTVLLHEVPRHFVMNRAQGLLQYLLPTRQDTQFYEYLSLLHVLEKSELKQIIVKVSHVEASWNEVEQIGRALDRIAATGKRLVTYSEGGNLKSLYLLSTGEQRLVAPHADFMNTMPNIQSYFVKQSLAKVGIKVETYAAGKFKAGGFEMFTRDAPSPESERTMKTLIGDLRARILERLFLTPGLGDTEHRKLRQMLSAKATLDADALCSAGFFHGRALASRLLDRVLLDRPNTDQLEVPATHGFAGPGDKATISAMEEAVGPMPTDPQEATRAEVDAMRNWQAQEREKVRALKNMTDEAAIYRRHRRKTFPLIQLRSLPTLGLVVMEGPIHMGDPADEPGATTIAALPFRKLIDGLANGQDQAVFLYINSPGGAADASEVLFESIYNLSRTRPVFALLGSVAASGGYYIACAANQIYASPFSLTGSIGVLRIRPNLQGLYKRAGVKKSTLLPGPLQDMLSEAGPLATGTRKEMKGMLKDTYGLFVERVRLGRGLSTKQVEENAQGQVWTGSRFIKAGLVDGDLDFLALLNEYRKSMGYKESQQFRMNIYPQVRTDFRTLISNRLPGGLAGLLRLPPGEQISGPIETAIALKDRPLMYSPLADCCQHLGL